MNKSELVAEIASKAGVTQADAGAVVDAMMDTIIAQVKKGGEVNICLLYTSPSPRDRG